MAPLIVLCTVMLLARALGAMGVTFFATWPAATATGLAAMFVLTGVSHFTPSRRDGLVAIVPPRLPHPGMLVTLTGTMELVGAVALLIPPGSGPFRQLAAWGFVVLLVAMFPANVHAATARRSTTSPHTPLALRTSMQAVFLAASLLVAVKS